MSNADFIALVLTGTLGVLGFALLWAEYKGLITYEDDNDEY